MDRLPQDVLDSIRDFILNKDGSDPDLADMLVAFWDRGDPDAPDPRLPQYPLGVTLLASYLNFSHTKRWAWDGLERLFRVLVERGEPIPDILQEHVNRVHLELVKPPRKPRNPRYAPQDARDFRLVRVRNVLCGMGFTKRDAENAIMDALVDHVHEDTLRNAFRKMRRFHPFKTATMRLA